LMVTFLFEIYFPKKREINKYFHSRCFTKIDSKREEEFLFWNDDD